MQSKPSPSMETREFNLNESVDVTCINRFYEQLNSLLSSSTNLTVDTGNVKRIDTAGLQLLCCWYLETKKRGIAVNWKNTQGIFYESARLLGLVQVLEL